MPRKVKEISNVMFVELASGAPDTVATIDGMAPGSFVSMSGKRITINAAEFGEYIAHTQSVLDSTKDSNGNIVGLPIDQDGHDHKGGAGWIVGVERDPSRSILRFAVRWTQIGADLIGGNIRRFFSPSFDPEQKVILGGSMTNSPASRDSQYRMMLRPTELSANIQAFAISDSMGSIVAGVCDEFHEQFGCMDMMNIVDEDAYFRVFQWPSSPEVYDDYLVAVSYDGDDLYKVGYTVDGTTGEVVFTPRPEWVGLKITYQEQPQMVEQSAFVKDLTKLLQRFTGQKPTPDNGKNEQGASDMANGATPTTADLMASPEAVALIEERVNQRAAELAKQAERKGQIEDFAAKMTGGETGKGYGLAYPKDKMVATLLAMPEAQAAEIMAMLEAKAVKFVELGHGHDFTDNKEAVPAQYVQLLKEWVKGGKTADEFFSVNPEIGKAEQFDLSAYEPKKEGK